MTKADTYKNVAIIGMGRFGQAIASLLSANKTQFSYAKSSKPLDSNADMVFLSVPTQHIRTALQANKHFINTNTIIINCSKGIEESTHLLPHQIVNTFGNYPNYYCLSGPSFSKEIIQQNPTIVSLGHQTSAHVDKIVSLLQTPYFKVQPSTDYKAIELAGALKNVYAILCGYAEGSGYGVNTRVRIVLAAQKELLSLAKAMGYPVNDISIPAITGDLMLTCSSRESRNFTYGRNLAAKHDANPHESRNRTIEGYHTCHSITALAARFNVGLPLAEFASQLTTGTVRKQEFNKLFG